MDDPSANDSKLEIGKTDYHFLLINILYMH